MRRDPVLRRGPWHLAAEFSCAVLGLGLVVASVRLFSDTTALVVLAAAVVGSWALSAALRRTTMNGWAAEILHGVFGLVLLLVIVAPAERWGILPTWSSLTSAVDTIRADFMTFDREVAPLEARTGHLVVMAALLWVLTMFNSTTAMRMRASVQAAVPHLFAFVGLGFVSREAGRTVATVAMLTALGIYSIAQVGWHRSALPWIPRYRSAMRRWAGGAASILLAAAVLATAGVAFLPGGPDPVLDLRRGGLGEEGPRTVVSPFVDVGTQLETLSDELLFTMTSDRAGYWRISALDDYEPGEAIWVLSNSYEAVDAPLEPDAEPGGVATMDVFGLGGIWVPSPEHPVSADADFGLNWDAGAASLIRRSGELGDGDRVGFATPGATDAFELLGVNRDDLAAATPSGGSTDLTDTSGAPDELVALAAELSSGLGPHDALLALQEHFRNEFTYDESVDLSAESDPLAAFLELRRGFCQQFSTAFALGARSLGFESRVVVGFTPGDAVSVQPDGTTTYAVRGRHAHAWPEVHFEGIGWVPYEPTPGRGNPATTALTGVAAGQADAPAEGAVEEAIPPATSAPEQAPSSAVPDTSPTEPQLDAGTDATPREQDSTSGSSLRLALAVALVVVVALCALVVWRRTRRSEHADPVDSAWQRAVSMLEERGFSMEPHDTPVEFAQRCGRSLDVPELQALADLESRRRWSAAETGTGPAGRAEVAGATLAALRERLAT
ncbi:MAG: transglutaminaseTgpA domain-containing protein [Microthrixaceae bacterium]|nr:transglutaminaseTgpA domain-containing protein [Microthrixaceae bacterium]